MALFERERELEQLDAALSAVLAGAGRVAVIQGSPGIGKSRLIDALCARATGSARVLRGRGGEQERELPLAVVRELFEQVVMRAGDDERARLLAGAAGRMALLLGVGTSEVSSDDSAFAVMHGPYWLTANLADDGPLVLAIDDAHWTDEATQRWLAYLIPRIFELPVLLALAFRPRELGPASRLAGALAAAPDAVLVEPASLGVEGTGALAGEVLGTPDAEFRASVHQATGGNPLLADTRRCARSKGRTADCGSDRSPATGGD